MQRLGTGGWDFFFFTASCVGRERGERRGLARGGIFAVITDCDMSQFAKRFDSSAEKLGKHPRPVSAHRAILGSFSVEKSWTVILGL